MEIGMAYSLQEKGYEGVEMIEGLMERREPRTFSIDKSKAGGHFSLFPIL